MTEITAVIVAKGYPKHIFETITSIENLAKEIIVVDIGLDNNCKEELLLKKVKLYFIGEKVPYVELIREWTKDIVTTKYILFLDPDEVVPKKLSDLLLENYHKYDFIKIPRKNIIFNKWIEHSRWWPDYQTRLFKKDKVIWSKELHSQPKTSGKGLNIEVKEETALVHYNYESIDDYITKMMRYAKSEASIKQEYALSHAMKDGLDEFISRYFSGKGYKDGLHGFILSFLQLIYPFLVYSYFWEVKKYNLPDDHTKVAEKFFTEGLYQANYWMENQMMKSTKSFIKRKIISKLLK